MKFFSVVALVAAIAGAAGTANAKVARYECQFDGNWLPRFLVVEHDTASGKVTVFDDLIKGYVGTPISGKVSADTKARTGFAWNFRVTSNTKQTFTMEYQLTYYKDGRPAKLTALPRGYDNSFAGEGACKVSSR